VTRNAVLTQSPTMPTVPATTNPPERGADAADAASSCHPRDPARDPAPNPAHDAARGQVNRPALAMNLRLIVCLAAVYLIWSSTYLAMAIAVRELPPMLMASVRYSAAGLVMLAIAKRRGAAWPSAAQWLRVAPIGALLFLGGNGFVAVGEQTVSSGGAAVVGAMMPLWTGVLSALNGERPSRREWASLIIGFIGVVVLMGGPSLTGKPVHIALILMAPMCWALGSILARRATRSSSHDVVLSSAMQMLSGAAALAIAGVARAERLPVHTSATAWLALGYLFVFGSLLGFTAYNWLLRHARPVVATSYAYVNPVLAVLIGAAAAEAFGGTTVIANVLIVGAVVLALGKPRAPRA
jgi:drug/metabolite transporter (DMT)-like permease